MSVDVISSHVTRSDSTCKITLVQLLHTGRFRVRLEIAASEYDTNCRASTSVWTAIGWQDVAWIPPQHQKTTRACPKAPSEKDFEDDRTELLRMTMAVLY